jgi:Maf1 regulator
MSCCEYCSAARAAQLTLLRPACSTAAGKKATDDKKLSKRLEQQMVELSQSPGTSPNFGPLKDASVRRTLIDLITTMNAHFPDYDFSAATADHFRKLVSPAKVMEKVDTDLGALGDLYQFNLKNELWRALNACIHLNECEVFTYVPDSEGDDPFTDGNLWHFNYFFFNAARKRMVYFTCMARSKYSSQQGLGGSAGSGGGSYTEEEMAYDDEDDAFSMEH